SGVSCARLEAPVAERLGDVAADLLASEVLKQAPPDDLTDLCFIISDEIFRDPPNDFRDSFLPVQIPPRHFDLAAWEREHTGAMRRAGCGDRKVLDECVECFGGASMTVQIVQHLVKQQKDGRVRRLEHPGDGLGTWRSRSCSGTERLDPLVAAKLLRDVDP